MNPEASRQNVPKLFPLSEEAIRSHFQNFGGFGPDELNLLKDTNISLLDNDNPEKILLEFGLRPELDLSGSESARFYYRAGVLLGLAISRSARDRMQVDLFGEEKDRMKAVDIVALRERAWDRSLSRMRRRPGLFDDLVSRFPEIYDFSPYFEHSDSIGYIGMLKAKWIASIDHKLLGVDAVNEEVDDSISIGLKDALWMFSIMYDSDKSLPNDEFAYNPKLHFLRTDPDKQKGPIRLTEYRFEFEPSDLSNSSTSMEQFRGRTIRCGYKGYRHTLMGNRSIHTENYDRWWDNRVPIGATVESVRTFLSGYAMDRGDEGDTYITEIGVKGSLRKFRLRPDDTLIARGAEGRFFNIPHPFVAHEDIVDDGVVHLLALIRDGKALPLSDTKNYSPEERELLRNFVQEMEYLHRRIVGRSIGRTVLFRATNPIALSVVPSAVDGVVSRGPARLPKMGMNLGLGVLMGLGSLYAHRRHLEAQSDKLRHASSKPAYESPQHSDEQ